MMRAAQRRLDELKQPAIAYLAYLLEQRDYPSAGLGAAKDVLDRVDGKPTENVRVAVSGDWEKRKAVLKSRRARVADREK